MCLSTASAGAASLCDVAHGSEPLYRPCDAMQEVRSALLDGAAHRMQEVPCSFQQASKAGDGQDWLSRVVDASNACTWYAETRRCRDLSNERPVASSLSTVRVLEQIRISIAIQLYSTALVYNLRKRAEIERK